MKEYLWNEGYAASVWKKTFFSNDLFLLTFFFKFDLFRFFFKNFLDAFILLLAKSCLSLIMT